MRNFLKIFAASLVGITALGVTAASAERVRDRDYRQDVRPEICALDHDHRSHAANYYNYYKADRYSRAGAYKPRVGFTITFGNSRYDDGYNRSDRYYNNGRYNNRRGDNRRYKRGNRDRRLVNREVFKTKHRARIVLKEEIVYGRRNARRVCTISVRGPEANYVPYRRLQKVANRNCSRHARIRIDA